MLITGGSRGLGLEIARVLVDKGAHVAIVARDDDEIQRALSDLRARSTSSVRIVGQPCDLQNGAAIDAMLEATNAQLGPIDVLINNAGVIEVGPVGAMRIEDFEQALRVHLFAPLRLMLAVRESMRIRGGGRIANIASIGGILSVPHLLPYCASKFALMGLSLGMRAELARDNIVISTIAPGLMRTGSPAKAWFKGDHDKEHAWFTILDALPGISSGSTKAAKRIVRAIEDGEAHVVVGQAAKLAALVQGLAPGLVARMMSVVNRLLPSGQDPQSRQGWESTSPLAPSLLTTLSDRAADTNNVTGP